MGLTAQLTAVGRDGSTVSQAVDYTQLWAALDRMRRGGWEVTWLPDSPLLDVRDFGAVGDGVTDDTAAIQAAINATAAVGAVCFLPPGTYRTTAALTAVAGKRNILVGAGRDSTVIKRNPGGAVINWTQFTHGLDSGSRLQDLTLDGNGGAGPVVAVTNPTFVHLARLFIYGNGPSGPAVNAVGLLLTSCYDSEFHDIYVTTCGGGATACVVLDCDATANNNLNNCQFYNLHVEPGVQSSPLLALAGNATNPVTDNHFFGLKTHGDPGGSPAAPIVTLSQFAVGNRFVSHIVAYGSSPASGQIECDGNRNSWYSPTFGGSAAHYGVNFTANSNMNLLVFPNFKTPAGYTAAIRTTGTKNKILFPPGNFAGAILLSDAGAGTVMLSDDLNTAVGLLFTAGQGLSLPVGGIGFFGVAPQVQANGFGTPTGAARLPNFPGATATLVQTSGALADLLTVLKTYGLIGG